LYCYGGTPEMYPRILNNKVAKKKLLHSAWGRNGLKSHNTNYKKDLRLHNNVNPTTFMSYVLGLRM
jgi:hypothetical protein